MHSPSFVITFIETVYSSHAPHKILTSRILPLEVLQMAADWQLFLRWVLQYVPIDFDSIEQILTLLSQGANMGML